MRLLWIAAGVVFVDQLTKIVVLDAMYPGQSIAVLGDWLKLTFTRNPGMAFGISFGPPGMVTAFSIIATVLIVLYLWRVRHGYAPYRFSLAFILGGAIGNIIDRMFYAMWFDGGAFFQGEVVDFIHVNIWRGFVPEAVPLMGGNYIALFPIWNVADMAIVLGVVGILVFQKKFHQQLIEEHERQRAAAEAAEVPVNGTAPSYVPPTETAEESPTQPSDEGSLKA